MEVRTHLVNTCVCDLIVGGVCEVEQFPVTKNVKPPWKTIQKAPPTKQEALPTNQEAMPTNSTAPSVPASSAQPKKEKEPKNKKGGGGKGGGAESAAPVDVSRLDMRVGRIQKAWKHPDADGLYVEEGEVGSWGAAEGFGVRDNYMPFYQPPCVCGFAWGGGGGGGVRCSTPC